MINFIILAGGKGSRMDSSVPKILCEISKGRTMLSSVINLVNSIDLEKNIILVTSTYIAENYFSSLPKNVNIAIQKNQIGTADAVKAAMPLIKKDYKKTIILYADVPFFTIDHVLKLINIQSQFTMISFFNDKKNEYGKLLTYKDISENFDDIFEIKALMEAKEFKKSEHQPKICNSGTIGIDTNLLHEYIYKIKNNNNAKEYYLTDIVNILILDKISCHSFLIPKKNAIGINSKNELEFARKIHES